jgi:hypothetical protein
VLRSLKPNLDLRLFLSNRSRRPVRQEDRRHADIQEPFPSLSRCVYQIMDVRSVCLEPVRLSVAEFSLPERPALSVGVASEHGCARLAPAHAAARRVSADQQVNLRDAGTSAVTGQNTQRVDR